MDKNQWAKTPPMGWNSWDCYGASVTEEELLKNAEYVAKYLKPMAGSTLSATSSGMNRGLALPITGFRAFGDGRVLPVDPGGQPVSLFGRGKRVCPIAEKIHQMGLRFGIHIMRGIPRQAVHADTPIKGTDVTARRLPAFFPVRMEHGHVWGQPQRPGRAGIL